MVYQAITNGQIDTNHPYVKILSTYQADGYNYCIGGEFIEANPVPRYDFMEYRLTPIQVKEQIKKIGFNDFNIVAFQTRNPMHKSHYQLTKCALIEATRQNGKPSKLLLQPVVGITQNCDIDYHTRVKCYKELINEYDEDQVILSLLPLSMRMAGPREAVWHAIIRKNYEATHFIVGRDHAGPSYDRIKGEKFYGPYDAQELLLKYADKIGIQVITSQMIVFSINREKCFNLYAAQYKLFMDQITESMVKNLDFMCNIKETDGCFKSIAYIDKSSELYFEISGTQQRKLLRGNKPIPSWFSYPKIINILRQEINNRKGIVFYFVGLSGSGNSTLANSLVSILKELTFRQITCLDGDVIRLHLSKGLGFSKEDRSTNVRRIGYVASEIAKHGGICVVANIAPYAADRQYNRQLIESVNGIYVEIYVDTILDECIKRDVKGLYKLAIDDKIKLTGINDPFEAPVFPDIHLDGTVNISENLEKIINYLKKSNYIIG